MIKKYIPLHVAAFAGLLLIASSEVRAEQWVIDQTEEWEQSALQQEGLAYKDGLAVLKADAATYRSKVRSFATPKKLKSLTITQSDSWLNWKPVDKVRPSNLGDAPVFLVRGDKDYWIFGKYSNIKAKEGESFEPQPADLEGFDVPLLTTPDPMQFKAPGGLKKNLRGYHAWQSRDMVHWVHHGPVTERFSRWVTTAEMVDGKAYIYYDFPNDQDPHLYIDDDLSDGEPGENMGMVFKDPSDGSDVAVIRDLDGKFHMIYEDWSPINAGQHSWDSPLAGHAVSDDGKGDFKILAPAVDERTNPTGKFAEYVHPHWHKEDPENYPGKKADQDYRRMRVKKGENIAFAKYEVHEPEQDAFGDWAAIAVGGQYYLFGDYHAATGGIRIGLFTSDEIGKPFEFCGEIGRGHPDPDIGFAEGRFYLVSQTKYDYVSDGPWVDGVEGRVGVDKDGNGTIDQWTDWQQVRESYHHIEGFSKQVGRIPAQIDASSLPASKGFAFELRVKAEKSEAAKPELDAVRLAFED